MPSPGCFARMGGTETRAPRLSLVGPMSFSIIERLSWPNRAAVDAMVGQAPATPFLVR